MKYFQSSLSLSTVKGLQREIFKGFHKLAFSLGDCLVKQNFKPLYKTKPSK